MAKRKNPNPDVAELRIADSSAERVFIFINANALQSKKLKQLVILRCWNRTLLQLDSPDRFVNVKELRKWAKTILEITE